MTTSIRLVALRPIALPHRTLAAGEALDFGKPDDLCFFTSRLRWSAFRIETVTDAPMAKADLDATAHQGLIEAAERLKAAEATIAEQAARIAELEGKEQQQVVEQNAIIAESESKKKPRKS